MCHTVQPVTLASEKYAEAALIGSVAINLASASFTHSLSHDFSPLFGLNHLTTALTYAFLLKGPACKFSWHPVVRKELTHNVIVDPCFVVFHLISHLFLIPAVMSR